MMKQLKHLTLPRDAGGDVVLALVVVSIANQVLTHILYFTASKSCAIVKTPIQHSSFPG